MKSNVTIYKFNVINK